MSDQMTTVPFGERLHTAIGERGRLCVGIDPHASLLTDWGLSDDVAGLERFALTATEAIAPVAGIVKPQSAFFERFGSAGVAVLERVVATAREAGALVLLDIKRGDIGSTSQAYADAYLDPRSPLACDAVTLSPYLGFGSLDPFLDTATRFGAGVFVLAFTSNPQGPQFQGATTASGATVGRTVLEELGRRNAGAEPMGSFGAVIGATLADGSDIVDFNGPVLAPGFGAQGGTVADLRRLFRGSAAHVLPSSSREVLGRGPSSAALREAVLRGNDALADLA